MHRNTLHCTSKERWCGTRCELWQGWAGMSLRCGICVSMLAWEFGCRMLLELLSWMLMGFNRFSHLSKNKSFSAAAAARLPPESFGTFVLPTMKEKYILKYLLAVHSVFVEGNFTSRMDSILDQTGARTTGKRVHLTHANKCAFIRFPVLQWDTEDLKIFHT